MRVLEQTVEAYFSQGNVNMCSAECGDDPVFDPRSESLQKFILSRSSPLRNLRHTLVQQYELIISKKKYTMEYHIQKQRILTEITMQKRDTQQRQHTQHNTRV